MFLRIIAALLIGTWAVLLLMGKGGFVHILVLNGLGVVAVDLMTVLRTRMTDNGRRTKLATAASKA